jgi:hypothetical protein
VASTAARSATASTAARSTTASTAAQTAAARSSDSTRTRASMSDTASTASSDADAATAATQTPPTEAPAVPSIFAPASRASTALALVIKWFSIVLVYSSFYFVQICISSSLFKI